MALVLVVRTTGNGVQMKPFRVMKQSNIFHLHPFQNRSNMTVFERGFCRCNRSAAKPQPKRLTTKARRHEGLSSGSLPAVSFANSTLKKCKKQNLILHSFLTFCFLHFFRVILRASNDPDLCAFVSLWSNL